MGCWTPQFVPQMWVRDNAVEVDFTGPNTWPISDAAVAEAFEAARAGSDWDYLRDDPSAPFWVREWPGPFYVELVSPDGETFSG